MSSDSLDRNQSVLFIRLRTQEAQFRVEIADSASHVHHTLDEELAQIGITAEMKLALPGRIKAALSAFSEFSRKHNAPDLRGDAVMSQTHPSYAGNRQPERRHHAQCVRIDV
jgi:hypothetical protein